MEYTKLFKLAKEIEDILPKHFYLAGGTAIMFKYDHRNSIDLDFFTETFSFEYYIKKFKQHFKYRLKEIHIDRSSDNIDFIIDGVKVSLVKFYFKNINNTQKINKLKIASDEDLLLNKLYVITRRAEAKDIFDIYFLLKEKNYSINQIKNLFEKKFNISFDESIKYLIRFKDYKINKKYSKKENEIKKYILTWVEDYRVYK